MPRVTGWSVVVTGTGYQDDIMLTNDENAERAYGLAVARVASAWTIAKKRPDGTTEKSATGTGTVRPR